MADRHQQRADDDGAAVAEHAVGDEAAEHRGQINQAGVEPINLRGERLDVERPEYGFEPVPQRRQPDDLFGDAGLKHVFHHVEHQQRPHAVVRKPLPHFGREQERQPAGVAEELVRCARARQGCRSANGGGFCQFTLLRSRSVGR